MLLSNNFSNCEKKFEYLQNKCKSLQKLKTRPRHKAGKLFRGFDNAAGEYDFLPNDDTIPAGWKSAHKNAEGLGTGTLLTVYWAPNGRFCYSRRGALHYMVHELGSDQADVEIMKRGLKDEGWEEDDQSLPKGWIVKTEKKFRSVRFISADFELYKTGRTALKHLITGNYSDKELEKRNYQGT